MAMVSRSGAYSASSQNLNEPSSRFREIMDHPTTKKTIRIVGIILGIGLAASFTPIAAAIGTAAAVVGAVLGVGLAGKCCYDWHCANSTGQLPLSDNMFRGIDSSSLKTLQTGKKILNRKDFLNAGLQTPPPVIGKSDFVPRNMVEHLMRDKKDFAYANKYHVGDKITNMEGALHTFVTPVCSIYETGDYKWMGKTGGLQGKPFGNNQVREVILSATIHPDFEYDNVMMPLVQLRDQAVVGESADLKNIPSARVKKDAAMREQYDNKLLKHMIYHLSPDHKLPARSEISSSQIMDAAKAKRYLETLICNPKTGRPLRDKFMRVKSKSGKESLISLEMLFRVYVEQIRSEFKALNERAPQGYVYTISPPSIFAKYLGDAKILNRLQALAFQSLRDENLFSNMRVLGYGDYADKGMTALMRKALPKSIQVKSQHALFDRKGQYVGPKGLALVLHNNSDGFGQNIEFEGPTSLDGVLGSFSNAACVLKRDRKDLLHFVV